MGHADSVDVEVVYALPHRARIVAVRVAAGTSVAAAIRQSEIESAFPEIDLARAKLGIHGRRVGPEDVVKSGDRIEIYRPLLADPKAVRRERAKSSRTSS